MALVAACPVALIWSWPAAYADGYYWAYCGEPPTWVEHTEIPDGYVMPLCEAEVAPHYGFRCTEAFTWVGSSAPDAGVDLAIAGAQFVSGFALVAVFWGLGRAVRAIFAAMRM